MDITQLLAFSVKNKASDLHLSAGVPPMIRVDGDMKRINMPALAHKEVHSMVYDIMNDKQRKAFEEFFETDFSFEIPKLARFRVNAFHEQGRVAAVNICGGHDAQCKVCKGSGWLEVLGAGLIDPNVFAAAHVGRYGNGFSARFSSGGIGQLDRFCTA